MFEVYEWWFQMFRGHFQTTYIFKRQRRHQTPSRKHCLMFLLQFLITILTLDTARFMSTFDDWCLRKLVFDLWPYNLFSMSYIPLLGIVAGSDSNHFDRCYFSVVCLFVCMPSVVLLHPAKAGGWNEMLKWYCQSSAIKSTLLHNTVCWWYINYSAIC